MSYEALPSGSLVKAPIDLIETHPQNPAPISQRYSEILGYPVRVEDAQVESLIELLRAEGYNPNKPMLLRPVSDRLQAVEGNHRFVAMWMLTKVLKEFEQDYIPAIVEDLSEEDALIKLSTLNTQRRMEGWRLARLAYYTCVEKGMSQPEYAAKVGYVLEGGKPNGPRISKLIQACRFVDYISANSPVEELQDVEVLTEPKNGLFRSVDRVAEFMYFDQEDWLWIAEFYLRHHMQISARQRVNLAKAIKDTKDLLNRSTSYPDRWSQWLRWEYIRGEVASQCAANEESQLAKSLLPQLISEANKTYESDDLPFIHNYHEVTGNRVEERTANLKEEFRTELIKQIEGRSAKFYRLVDVAEAARTVIDRYAFIEQKYENFKKIGNTVHIEQEIVAIAPPTTSKPKSTPTTSTRSPITEPKPKLDTEKRVWIEEQYQPKGIVSSLEDYTFHDGKQYGLIFSRLGNSGMEDFFQNTDYIYRTLTEGGVFALILPHKYSFAVIEELEYKVASSSRLHLRGLDGGIYSDDEKPRLAIAASNRTLIHQEYEELLLFTTQDDTPLPLRSPLPRMALEPVHDILTAFGDPNEPFLDPFAFSGEVVVAAKSLGYRCDYLVANPTQLDLVARWCDRTEFPESLFKA
jgi:hypothetical protein